MLVPPGATFISELAKGDSSEELACAYHIVRRHAHLLRRFKRMKALAIARV